MIVVSFDREMREAFAAGEAAATARLLARKFAGKKGAEFLERTPKTYEEWVEHNRDRPTVVRG